MVKIRAIDLVDVFAYLVVLGIFVQLFPEVITETFVLALLTALLLKLVLEMVLLVKKSTIARFRGASTLPARVASAVTLLLLLPGSKFLVLELVALVFGGTVTLGGFFQVTGLVVVLMLTRGGMRRLCGRDSDSREPIRRTLSPIPPRPCTGEIPLSPPG